MVPSTHLEVSPEPAVKQTGDVTTLVLETRKTPAIPPQRLDKPKRKLEDNFFQSSMLENNRFKSSSKLLDFLIALTVNVAILALPILAGLYYTDTLNLKQFTSTFLAAPPPPPPPPPAPAAAVVKVAPVHRVFESAGRLIAPASVPKTIADIKEAPLPPDVDGSGGVPGGVPGGVAGGSMGGVIGGVIGGVNTAVPLAPMAPRDNRPKAPVRIGGRVREPKLVFRVDPAYPPLAKQIHLQGTVVIDAILDEKGNVIEAKVTSGPPLLIQSALDAVRKWRYEPTYLNDQPVPVQLNVTVTFRLNE